MTDIPVTGFVYTDDEGMHSHNLYITNWDGRAVHSHEFRGVTSFDVGHDHRYVGTTEPASSGVQHRHRFSTVTSFDANHDHVIRGVTGPAIPLPTGGHYHEFSGVTTVDGDTPHAHRFSGRTSL